MLLEFGKSRALIHTGILALKGGRSRVGIRRGMINHTLAYGKVEKCE